MKFQIRETGSNASEVKAIFFEVGSGGGSANRLLQLLRRWDSKRYPYGVVCLYNSKKAFEILSLNGSVVNVTGGLVEEPIPDPISKIAGVPFITMFGLKYFVLSLALLRRYSKAVVYLNNTPYTHIPVILMALLMRRRIICHLRDTISFSVVEKHAARHIDHFIVLSKAALDFYVDQGVVSDKITVVYDSINIENVDDRPTNNYPMSNVIAVIVGSLVDRKGQDIAIRALSRVIVARPNARLILLGDGNARPKLQKLVESLGLADVVEFRGHLNDIGVVLRTADIGMLTSHREGMPNSVMEYMAYHLPVIVNALPGITELVAENVSGYIVRTEDELVAQWIKLIDNKEQRVRMGEEGFQRVRHKQFSPDSELAGITSTIDRQTAIR